LLIENMDKRNNCGRTQRELDEVFAKLPQAGLCFDIGHCRQVDPTMNEAYLILRAFRDRLRQLHVSEVNSRSTHDPLSSAGIDAFRAVASLIPENIPVILESPVSAEEVDREIEFARLALPISPTGSGANVRAANLHSAIA
jgi:sugar phosphate isomerase/epimerase